MNWKSIATLLLVTTAVDTAARADDVKPTTRPESPGVVVIEQPKPEAMAVLLDPLMAATAKTEKAAWLGVSTSRASQALLKQLKIKSGLLVDAVVPGSPAEAAGIKPLDILLKLDDQILINPAQLEGLVRLRNPNDSVSLALLHEGDHSVATAKLAEHTVLAMTDFDPQLLDGPFHAATATTSGPGGFTTSSNRVYVTPFGGAPARVTAEAVPGMPPAMAGVPVPVPDFESRYSDGQHQLTVVRASSGRVLIIKDAAGKKIFEGPVDSTDQQNGIPKELQPKFQEMQKMQNMTNDPAKP